MFLFNGIIILRRICKRSTVVFASEVVSLKDSVLDERERNLRLFSKGQK